MRELDEHTIGDEVLGRIAVSTDPSEKRVSEVETGRAFREGASGSSGVRV